MTEDEIIDTLKEIDVVDFYNTYTDSKTDFSEPRKYCDAIQGLLDLYQKEKEKNKKIDLHYVPYEQYITKLNKVNEKWKDKIRGKIEKLEKELLEEE